MRNPEKTMVQVADLNLQLTRKAVKNLRIMVCPPDGEVRVSAPWAMTDGDIRAAILARLSWIRQHQQQFQHHTPSPVLEYQSGETHSYLGQNYILRVHEMAGRGRIEMCDDAFMEMYCPPEAAQADRQALLHKYYRQALKDRIPNIVAHYEPILGVQVAEWGVKRMRTRWGTCNIRARRIWLGLELARYAEICLEYVVLHEMTHLLERLHNDRFRSILDAAMPDWRRVKNQLRSGSPLLAESS
ncbi:M48 family metallopeptidase [Acidithiobacillus sp. HP-2]|nr:SprT family zinc-dependent metalloprotease [Acidithiobacillus sp. HP-2]